jgi:inner membrane protease subunit 1
MLPTLSPSGDWVLYSRLPYHFPRLAAPFARGDVVIALHPFMPDRAVGKRIIGLEGDTVEVNPAGIRVDAEGAARGTGTKYVKIPPGHCWLQGDNLSNSTDSRDYGPVPMALVQARVEARVCPSPPTCRALPQSFRPSPVEPSSTLVADPPSTRFSLPGPRCATTCAG